MRAVHGLIIVVTGLPTQACIQMCINASKVFFHPHFILDRLAAIFEASSAPSRAHLSSPNARADGGAPTRNSMSMGAHFSSKFGLHGTVIGIQDHLLERTREDLIGEHIKLNLVARPLLVFLPSLEINGN